MKRSCTVDRELTDEYGVDVELPRYWYQYGEILNEQPISNSTYTVTPAEWDGRNVQPAPGADDSFVVPGDVRKPIREVVRKLAHRFAQEDADAIKRHQYENHASNEFVRQFDAFREFVSNQDEQNTSLFEFGSGDVSSPEERGTELLDSLVQTYPTEEYTEMYDVFFRWDDTTRLLLKQGEFEAVAELLAGF